MEILKYNIKTQLKLDDYPSLVREIYHYIVSTGLSFPNQDITKREDGQIFLNLDGLSTTITRRENSIIINEKRADGKGITTSKNIFLGLNGHFYFQIVVSSPDSELIFSSDSSNDNITMYLPTGKKMSDFSYLTYFKDVFAERGIYVRTYMDELSKLATSYSIKEKIVKQS